MNPDVTPRPPLPPHVSITIWFRRQLLRCWATGLPVPQCAAARWTATRRHQPPPSHPLTTPVLIQDPLQVVLLIALLGFLVGAAKGGFSGLGALLVPLLSLVLPVATAVGMLLPMLMVGDAFAIYSYWREWDLQLLRRMLLPGALGALAGTALLTLLAPTALRLVLAIFVVLLVGYKLLSDRLQQWRYTASPWHAPAAGALAGLASGLFNNGGPPFNSYMLLLQLPPRVFIATATLFFALINIIKVPGFLYTGVLDVPRLLSLWWVFPCIPVGIVAARLLVLRLNQLWFERVVMAMLLSAAGLLLWQSG